ncbi:MAG: hypothetical protein AAF561_11050, partial [Planctomycetota bacterium]
GRNGFHDSVEQMAEHLFNFTKLNRRQRIEVRNRVEKLSGRFDWSVLGRHYHSAHEQALGYLSGGKPERGSLELVEV